MPHVREISIARRREVNADDVIARFAGQQDGVVARWQLLRAGVAPGAIDRRIARG